MALAGAAVVWAGLFVLPLAVLYLAPGQAAQAPPAAGEFNWLSAAGLSVALAAAVATLSVVLGYLPGRLLASQSGGWGLLGLAMLLGPLVMPSYVLQYAWQLPLTPTAAAGKWLMNHPAGARAAATAVSVMAMALWHWPVAALLLGQGWRNMDRSVLELAELEAGGWRRFRLVTLPLLARPMALAWGVCFALGLAEFTTFHLAGLKTLGTELTVALQQDQVGGEHWVARAAWPLIIPAAAVAIALWRSRLFRDDSSPSPAAMPAGSQRGRLAAWLAVGGPLGLSFFVPAGLLVLYMNDLGPIRQFWAVHRDELAWSAGPGLLAAALALGIALAALTIQNAARRSGCPGMRTLSAAMYLTILLSMFLPPAIVSISLLKLLHAAGLSEGILPVTLGLTVRYTGLALIMLALAASGANRRLGEMAAVEGAGTLATWRHIHLPRLWPVPLACLLLIVMFGMTEVPASMILLPAGAPNFAQRLLNQMHYGREQEVVALCLVLLGGYVVLAGALGLLLRAFRRGENPRLTPGATSQLVAVLLAATLILAGCEKPPAGQAKVLGMFGKTGAGPGEFTYPRCIDRAADGTLYVCDKTGRIQHMDIEGNALSVWQMPESENGKPTGLSVGPDGNVYVADTHYHRVTIFDPQGQVVRTVGRSGQGPGEFVYPTDVAFAPDGRIFVSEYGGNDRVSIFDKDWNYLGSFGSPGSESGQFCRPAALAIDASRGRLYVADACNHRIALYDLAGNLQGYWCSAGEGPGQLRYPYGLCLLEGGELVVCEFGNNRLQVFAPDGTSVGIIGSAGRGPGQLVYPWAVVGGANRQVFVIDSGNNRVQRWQL